MAESISLEKAVKFAIRVVNLYKHLTEEKREFVMSKKLLDVGTDIGQRLMASQQALSRADFIAEQSMALKQTDKTQYWLDLLHKTDFITAREHESISADCLELHIMLTASVKTAKGQ
jgi:four helix bundle protein